MQSLKLKVIALKDKFYKNDFNIYIFAFLFLGLISLFSHLQPSKSNDSDVASAPESTDPRSVDTFIPAGFSLVPVEIFNAESLDSLIGALGGVVDLYLPQEKGASKLIAHNVKLMRAPRNNQTFAVLVKNQESSQILNYKGPFVAVVQNPEEKGRQVSQPQQNSISIQYQH